MSIAPSLKSRVKRLEEAVGPNAPTDRAAAMPAARGRRLSMTTEQRSASYLSYCRQHCRERSMDLPDWLQGVILGAAVLTVVPMMFVNADWRRVASLAWVDRLAGRSVAERFGTLLSAGALALMLYLWISSGSSWHSFWEQLKGAFERPRYYEPSWSPRIFVAGLVLRLLSRRVVAWLTRRA